MSTEVTLPVLGESVTDGTVSRWLKKVGDRVERDEVLLEVSTDKVDVEISSPASGFLTEIRVPEDQTVLVGTVLGTIGDSAPVQEPQPVVASEPIIPPQPVIPPILPEPVATIPVEQPVPEQVVTPHPPVVPDVAQDFVSRPLVSPTPVQPNEPPRIQFIEPLPMTNNPAQPVKVPEPVITSFAPTPPEVQPPTPEVQVSVPDIQPAVPEVQIPVPEVQVPAPEVQIPVEPVQLQTPQPVEEPAVSDESPQSVDGTGHYVTPLVRKLAREAGLPLTDIEGSGVGGRIRKSDVIDAIEQRVEAPVVEDVPHVEPEPIVSPVSVEVPPVPLAEVPAVPAVNLEEATPVEVLVQPVPVELAAPVEPEPVVVTAPEEPVVVPPVIEEPVVPALVAPEPELIETAEPEPIPEPEPESVSLVAPEPVVVEPEPLLAPEPVTPEPVVIPEPEPTVVPEPEPAPEPGPEPMPVVVPEPEPIVVPEPEQISEPEPEPVPAGPVPCPECEETPVVAERALHSSPSAVAGTTEKMSRLRSTIARRMVESLHVSAQLTATLEVDVTAISHLRTQIGSEFETREGFPIDYLPFIAKATLEALGQYPKLNAMIDTDEGTITYPDAEHLGIAIATPKGLLVPVIRNANDFTVEELAVRMADLANRTSNNKILPDDLVGGTFTITDYGSVGTLFDTPIINQPQVGILGVGAITRRPVAIDDPKFGEVVAVRDMMYLSLSYDHRLIDGSEAAQFLGTIKARLEAGDFGAEF